MDTEFPPRGSGKEGRVESMPSQIWGHPSKLGPNWDWKPGKVLLGTWEGRVLGLDDDRHMVTIAGSRAGKTATVLIPNIRRYPGSKIILDPKGELARATAQHCAQLGQRVFVLDPFGASGIRSASFNPFDALGHGNTAMVAADLAQALDALIINNASDPHWTDSAKMLMRGLLLHIMATTGRAPTMRALRSAMSVTNDEFDEIFTAMTKSQAFDGIVANTGASFLGKLHGSPREFQSILSTAQTQTAPFDDLVSIMDRSDFALTDLGGGKTTIYVVLPSMRMATHYRWMRLMIQAALAAMEVNPVPRGRLPVWFVLEEFPTLGHLRSIEAAAGLVAGFGVKLWAVIQDLTQLQTHYAKSWETFLGNAGIVQSFGNADVTTCDYISKRLGASQVIERQQIRVSGTQMGQGDTGLRENLRSVRLLDPNEVMIWFARETNRQLILSAGRPPIYFNRLSFE